MFYFLYEVFNINILSYITVRAGLAFFLAFFFAVKFMPKFIAWAKDKKANQPIYELAPKSHQNKGSTPTMGGIVFTGSAVIASLLAADLSNIFVIAGLLTLMGFGYTGFRDDYAKILDGKNHSGMSAKRKLLYQISLSLLVAIVLYFFTNLDSQFYLPFYKHPIFNMYIFAIFFWTLVMTASSNAVNLTDGLDGLAAIPSVFSLSTLGVFIYLSGHAGFAQYLLLPKIIGIGEVGIICSALVGSLLGFLWYNCHPAEVFMGDSGSLSIGAFIGYCGVISKNELLLIIIGFIFVMETMSVILQVGSFKIFKKRVFLMAPIHHHFELKGWNENKIIVRFWIIALIVNIIALTSIKLR